MNTIWRHLLMVTVMSAMTSTVHAGVDELYSQSCATCHAAGVLGAPKSGDQAAWVPRLKQGMPLLIEHTRNGYKNMPARGLCDSCTEADYAALIKLMSK
jgi:cytochrome c5